jgi:DNA repair protein RecN (Recombination protein N)
MLTELRVRDLGVIAEMSITLGPGMTVFTGETGAGKTLIVTAISLLMGARSDASMVRPGATEALVEARFEVGEHEHIIRRVIPASGRTRCYVDGSLATLAELDQLGAGLVDLHGQHDHQSLLSSSTQRLALDRFGGVDLGPLREVTGELVRIEEQLTALGGDSRDRDREAELLRHQVAELESASIRSANEEDELRAEAELLADASGHREAAERAVHLIGTDGGALDQLSAALASLGSRAPFEGQSKRLQSLLSELSDLSAELRRAAESIESNPERLAAIGERRRDLQDLRRKYGDTLAQVIDWYADASERLLAMENRDTLADALEIDRSRLRELLDQRRTEVAAARRAASAPLAERIAKRLPDLALEKASLAIEVDGPAGDDVRFLLSANPGMPLQPLARVASGGELARAMLALRLVLSDGPPVLIFDEVDAGIGGAAALAVGRALAEVSDDHQVLVVTHLAQVAAWATAQVVVDKAVSGETTTTSVVTVTGDQRISELARMLSGTPASATAREHAREMLEAATR